VPPALPLFTTMLNYRHSHAASAQEPVDSQHAWDGIRHVGGEERTNYPLTGSVDDLGVGFSITTKCVKAIDPSRINAYLNRAMESLIAALRDVPEKEVRSLDILPETERHQLLVQFNDTAAAYPQDQLIHQLFEQQAALQPEATAVVHEQDSLTYAELNRRANQVAHRLLSLGVKPDDRVAICVERSLEMVVGLLGILKAGAAYVPLDPAYPHERLAYMLEDSAPVAVLTQSALRQALPLSAAAALTLPVLELDVPASFADQAEHNPDPALLGLHANHLAYVLFTSGSTGQPKGAMNMHCGIVNRLNWMRETMNLTSNDRTLQKTTLSFDVSVYEIFLPLSIGGQIYLAKHNYQIDIQYLAEAIESYKITLTSFVPSVLKFILELKDKPKWSNLRHMISGGEPLTRATAQELIKCFPHVELCNIYGPTETSIGVTYGRVLDNAFQSVVSIGRPISNVNIYILDNKGNPVPLGSVGEIHIGGIAVGRGYLNNKELTAKRFINITFDDAINRRLYKTGDLARYDINGNIEYIGRLDFQVKIRGIRIELGEIEQQLTSCKGIKRAAVVAKADKFGQPSLAAYFIEEEGSNISKDEVIEDLSRKLPEYMIPHNLIKLENFPLTFSGKLDISKLPDLESLYNPEKENISPVGEMECFVAETWEEILKIKKVYRDDNFFELGGHSLMVMQVLTRINNEYDVEIPISKIFASQTLKEFSKEVLKILLSQYAAEDVSLEITATQTQK
ncbi:amino acid adenylation domain-containing protein, partial [Massilia phyllosphaerae]|uniref:amino acid adenylation domain-containing protein n=1 Tax=Massilia phyllosphaerae TaxID=3106034 RepID=UPI002B1CAEDD